MGGKLLFVVNNPSFFISHRLPLALAAKETGWDVHIASMPGAAVDVIVAAGFRHHALPLSRSGVNPFAEMRTMLALFCMFQSLKPDLVHLVTIKPVIYGGIAARLTRVPAVVAAISGLGYLFTRTNRLSRALLIGVGWLYRLALGHKHLCVIFQNKTDAAVIQRLARLKSEHIALIRGSGVELTRYRYAPEPSGVPVFTMAARLLRDKGVEEFVQAAEILRGQGWTVRCCLVGDIDPENPSSCTDQDLDRWRKAGAVEILGQRDDIPELFAASHVIVLPSYREGLPKVLAEAAACGRAVITTDVPGCKDAILPDVSGLLVPARDTDALAEAMKKLAGDVENRQKMGREGRRLAESEFDIKMVVQSHMAIYNSLK